MKSKCHSLWISIWIVCGSILLAVAFQFVEIPNKMYELQNFCIVVLAGMVSGSVVAFVIFVDEYRSEKRETLEEYADAAEDILACFLRLKCFVVKEPIKLLRSYYSEEERNAMTQILGHKSKDADNKLIYNDDHTLTFDVRDEWCKLVEPEFFSMKDTMPPEEYQKLLIDEVERRAREYRELMDKAIDSYVSLWDEVSYYDLDNIYRQIAFFTGDAPRLRILKDIHTPLHSQLPMMQTTIDGRFGLYKGGKDTHCAHVLSALIDVQKQIFGTEIREDNEGKATAIYNDFYTRMEKQVENLRARISSTEPSHEERYCVGIVRNL